MFIFEKRIVYLFLGYFWLKKNNNKKKKKEKR